MSRRPLETPLAKKLRDPVTGEALGRVESRLFTELDQMERARARGPSWRLAAPLVAVVLATLFLFTRPASHEGLLTEGGQEFTRLDAGPSGRSVRFSDGSRISARSGARVVGVLSTAEEFVIALERGHIDVEVTPGGPRRWIVETGLGQVQVVGTEFSVSREPAGLKVIVHKGIVLVRSQHLASAVARLQAGESIEIPTARPVGSRDDAPGGAPVPAEPERAIGLADLPEVEVVPPGSPPASLPQERGARRASGEEGSHGAEPSVSSDLFALLRTEADAARARGEFERAAALFERLVASFPGDPRLPFVLYGWGATLSQQGDVGGAVSLFERALALGASRSLSEDLLLRLVRSKVSQGDLGGARGYAARYQREFPEGRYRAAIRTLLSEAEAPAPGPTSGTLDHD